MRRNLICARRCFITALILAIGLSAYGCSDSASVSDDVQVPLSSLTVTPGSLRPAFFSNTTNYTVNAPTSATSVTVKATPKDSTVIMTINGILTAAGQGRSVTLGAPGSTTTITILLEAQNGTETTYTVNVTRLLSSDNNLSALDVTPGDLNPPFDPETLDYTVNVGVLVDSVTVSATKSDQNAVMVITWATGSVTIGPGDNSPGQGNIPLGAPGTATPVSIEVTAPNSSKKTYQVTINRLSGDNNLSALTVMPGDLVPAFDRDTLAYTVNVSTDVTQVTVAATKSDPNAAMTGSVTAGAGIPTGTEPITLGGPGSDTDVLITVAAADPTVPHKNYLITIKRATPAAPSAPTIAPDLIAEDDSCLRDLLTNNCIPPTSDNDDITNVTTPRFTVATPAAGETPNLYVDGVKVKEGFDQGTNTLTPPTPLNDGAHSITYTVSNVGGESAQSPSLIVTIDTVAP